MVKDLIFDDLKEETKALLKNLQEDGVWLYYDPVDMYFLDDFGFKIHISATILNVKKIFNIVFPILVENDVMFKFCKTYTDLIHLNTGYYGHSQIGKVCTIYPKTDEQLNLLLELLYRETKAYTSVEIPSDYRYKNSSVVYYRYGEMLLQSNEQIKNTDFVDNRVRMIPNDVIVPIEDFYISRKTDIKQKYHPLKCLKARGKSTVHLAIDIDNKDLCILKRGYYLGEISIDGEDGLDKVYNEYNMLLKFQDKNIFPAVRDIFYYEDTIVLVEEFIEGESFAEIIEKNIKIDVEIFTKILDAILIIHNEGFIINDLSADNVIVDLTSNSVRFIDAEQIVLEKDYKKIMNLEGTPGFISGKYSLKDKDIYSFLCLIYYYKKPEKFVDLMKKSLLDTNLEELFSLGKNKISDLEKVIGESEELFFNRDYDSKIIILENIISDL